MSTQTNAAVLANNITDFLVLLDDLPLEDYDLALGYVRCEFGHGDLEDKFVSAAVELLKAFKNKHSKV